MKKNIFFLVGVIALAAGAFYIVKTQYQEKQQEVISEKAPEFLIRDYHPTIGDKSAPVTMVEFLDPECESCAAMDPVIKGLLKEFEGKIHFVVRYMPLHNNSVLAAAALEETRPSGKYFQALSGLLYYQPEWADHQSPKPEMIAVILKRIGVDIMSSNPNQLIERHKKNIEQDQIDAKALGVTSTPTIFINGKMMDNLSYGALKAKIQASLN